MANTNTTTQVVPQLLAQGLLALRQMAVMPRYVNRAYEATAGEKGSSIDVPIPSAITAQAVSPSYVPPDDAGVAPTSVNLPLSQWYEAPFFLSDKDMLEVQSGTIPMQATEAVKALANNVDSAILALYTKVYGWAGVSGTTPFAADLAEFLDARKILNNQLAPSDPRFVAIDPDSEANALGLRAFQDAAFRGDRDGILNGQIGFKLGSTWFMDQNMPTHTVGNWSAGTASGTAGSASVTINSGTGAFVVGDVLLFAGDTQTYTVLTVTGTAPTTAITVGPGIFQSAVDPVSGLTLRLEVSRQHKRTRFAYDILYGVQAVRPELACRIAG
jgi:hypothetical protein